MTRRKQQKRIRLENFGSVIGLIFEDGGSAEVLMTFPELSHLVKSWLAYEESKRKPGAKTIAALNVLREKVYKFDAGFVAEVPIAKVRAKIVPVIPSG